MRLRPFPVLALILAGLALHCGGGGSSQEHSAPAVSLRLSYPPGPTVAYVGQPMTVLTPAVQGTATAWSVAPALPPGLNLDPSQGFVSGTPTAPAAQASYVVTARNGTVSASASFTLKVVALVPGSARLSCGVVQQEHSQWCWAASSASLLAFVGTPVSQCEIVNQARSITSACGNGTFAWNDPVANAPIEALYGPAPSVQAIVAHYGHPAQGRNAALTFEEVQGEVNARRPFFVNWAWKSGGGHILLGTGWDTTTGAPEMVLMDPWPNEGLKTVSYAWVLDGSDSAGGSDPHVWRWTLTLVP
ncbi:MAG: C39 family peptidase [Acidobacteria bacterium]|nr:C39 family peptidase [Acidobacteriota bacterium]MBI3489684.1 C39 family peptidase [Acidobacteriota bacterium]